MTFRDPEQAQQVQPQRTVFETTNIPPGQSKQIQDLARAAGLDPRSALDYIQNARVTRTPISRGGSNAAGVPSSVLIQVGVVFQQTQTDGRYQEFARNILEQGYGDGRITTPSERLPGFNISRDGLLITAHSFTYQIGRDSTQIAPQNIEPRTEAWINREAGRMSVDAETTRYALVAYSRYLPLGQDFAAEVVERLINARTRNSPGQPDLLDRTRTFVFELTPQIGSNPILLAEISSTPLIYLTESQMQNLHAQFRLHSRPALVVARTNSPGNRVNLDLNALMGQAIEGERSTQRPNNPMGLGLLDPELQNRIQQLFNERQATVGYVLSTEEKIVVARQYLTRVREDLLDEPRVAATQALASLEDELRMLRRRPPASQET